MVIIPKYTVNCTSFYESHIRGNVYISPQLRHSFSHFYWHDLPIPGENKGENMQEFISNGSSVAMLWNLCLYFVPVFQYFAGLSNSDCTRTLWTGVVLCCDEHCQSFESSRKKILWEGKLKKNFFCTLIEFSFDTKSTELLLSYTRAHDLAACSRLWSFKIWLQKSR